MLRRDKKKCPCGEPVAIGSKGHEKAWCWECLDIRNDQRKHIKKVEKARAKRAEATKA